MKHQLRAQGMQRLLQHFLWNFCTRQLGMQLYVKQIWFPPRPPFLKAICGGVCAAQSPFLASRPCGHMKQSRRVWRPVWAWQVLLWTFSRSWRAFIPIQLLERKLAGMPSFACIPLRTGAFCHLGFIRASKQPFPRNGTNGPARS